VAQVTSVARRLPPRRARVRRSSGGSSPRPRLNLFRLALLVLVLIGASFYLGPLREFFAQQDRFQQKTAALEAAKADNSDLKRNLELLKTDGYIAQQALGSLLVEPGTQVFVIQGLPGRAEEDAARREAEPTASSISVLDRVEDLWRTLLR
jgi:cell division protein FtsB